MDSDDSDKQAEQRRRLIFVHAICLSAIDRLDPDDLDELGLITRLQEIAEMIESDLERLIGLD
jgi:hypothetical protein